MGVQDDKRALAELLGLEYIPEEEDIQKDRKDEAILAYLTHPKMFQKNHCLACGNQFKVNRRNVAYCSRDCRRIKMKQLGYHSPKVEARLEPEGENDSAYVDRVWWGDEPLIIPEPELSQADKLLGIDIRFDSITVEETVSIEDTADPDEDIADDTGLERLLNLNFKGLSEI